MDVVVKAKISIEDKPKIMQHFNRFTRLKSKHYYCDDFVNGMSIVGILCKQNNAAMNGACFSDERLRTNGRRTGSNPLQNLLTKEVSDVQTCANKSGQLLSCDCCILVVTECLFFQDFVFLRAILRVPFNFEMNW